MLTDMNGNEIPKDKAYGVKIRLAQVYRTSGQTTLHMMGELKSLTEQDLADFREWFNAAGYPTN